MSWFTLSAAGLNMTEAVIGIVVAIVFCIALIFNVMVLMRIWRMTDDVAGGLARHLSRLSELNSAGREQFMAMRTVAGSLSSHAESLKSKLEEQLSARDQIFSQVREAIEGSSPLDEAFRLELRNLTAALISARSSLPPAILQIDAPVAAEAGTVRELRLEQENVELSNRLEEVLASVSELRSAQRKESGDAQDAIQLRTQLDQAKQLVRRMRQRVAEGEEKQAALALRLERESGRGRRAAEGFEAMRVELMGRISELTSGNRRLEQQLAEMAASTSRLNREKALIEERYVQLDSQVRAANSS